MTELKKEINPCQEILKRLAGFKGSPDGFLPKSLDGFEFELGGQQFYTTISLSTRRKMYLEKQQKAYQCGNDFVLFFNRLVAKLKAILKSDSGVAISIGAIVELMNCVYGIGETYHNREITEEMYIYRRVAMLFINKKGEDESNFNEMMFYDKIKYFDDNSTSKNFNNFFFQIFSDVILEALPTRQLQSFRIYSMNPIQEIK